ncbi:glycosyltransferase family 39 protein [Tundrisphaera sp. TA3]|uniref:glycosyltransferase family 39 protein n=1 Tax=Tundrisphaera sp. TA3 TaxID=3435775 RepID=UPI003EB9D165
MSNSEIFKRAWFAFLISAAVVVPRSLLIASSHSESYDDRYHIRRGLGFWTGTIPAKNFVLNDPPLGEAIIAFPVYLVNLYKGYPPSEYAGDGKPISLEAFAQIFAVWKSILFCLSVALAFHWCRQLYGLRSAWFVMVLLTFEPNLAAHVPVPSLDILGMEAILLASYLSWKFTENPTRGRAIGLGAGAALAVLIKHTAIILPFVILLTAALQWLVRPRLSRAEIPPGSEMSHSGRLRLLALAGVSGAFFLWAFLLFDRTPPLYFAMDDASRAGSNRPELRRILESRLPAGLYLSSIIIATSHGKDGHPAYLFGEKSTGWWYYLPAVALYKVPIGIWFLMILAAISVRTIPPKWAEWGLALPAIAWGLFLMSSRFSIGFRHAFPCYIFLIMLVSRCASASGRFWKMACCGAALATALHSLSYHPNYIGYINIPREKAYLAISDSNVDWSQSLKQVRTWLDTHPTGSRPVTLAYFGIAAMDGQEVGRLVEYYLDKRVTLLDDAPLPTQGLIIASPVLIAGAYEANDRFAALRQREPDDIIGDCMLVYDLDQQPKP